MIQTQNPRILRLPVLFSILTASLVGNGSFFAREVVGDQTSASIASVQAGFDGHYKAGCWTPVVVTVTGGSQETSGRLSVIVADSDGVPTVATRLNDASVTVSPGEQKTVTLYTKFGRVGSGMTVIFTPEQGNPIRQELVAGSGADKQFLLRRGVSAKARLVVTIGPECGVDAAARLGRRRDERPVVSAVVNSGANLPEQWRGYDGVDLLVLVTSDADLFHHLSKKQIAAMRRWVEIGGRLLLSAGHHGEVMLGPSGPLACFAPGKVVGSAEEPSTSGLESFTESIRPVDLSGAPKDWKITLLSDVHGEVLASESIRIRPWPTIIHSSFGLGVITTLAFDLDASPIAAWPQRSRLVDRLLENAISENLPPEQSDSSQRASHLGYDDLAGQLRSGLDQFDQVNLVPFSWIVGLVIAWLLVIGPLDYFLLKYSRKRMEWTWLTFTIATAAFCGIAIWGLGHSRGDNIRVNQATVIDIDCASGIGRGNSWVHVYSPKYQQFDLRYDPTLETSGQSGPAIDGIYLSWQGLPGGALGGMSSGSPLIASTNAYDIATLSEPGKAYPRRTVLEGMPISPAGTKSLSVEMDFRSSLSAARMLTTNRAEQLFGSVKNPLSCPLTEVFVLHKTWAYEIGRLDPGEEFTLDEQTPRQNVESMLTRRRLIESERTVTPWEQSDTHIPRILEIMMFHEAAGGMAYTGMFHRHEGRIDLSNLARSDKAVLVGSVPNPAGLLLNNDRPLASDHTEHWTYFRFVIPLEARQE